MVTSIEQQYVDLHPESLARYEVAKDLFPNGVTHDARNLTPFPYYVTHSEGAVKYDVDGNKIVDYKTGHGALILGHNHPAVVKAVQDQMAIGTHWSASTDIEIRWGELVTELVPCAEKVRFNSSGTEADMMAMRMARAYTGRDKIIRFKNHFHGWSDYAVPGWAAPSGVPDGVVDSIIVLEPNDISQVEQAIAGGDVAGVILEPTGAHMGQEPIAPSFLEELRQVTEQNGVVYIMDEVVTGFRTSRNGASGYYGVVPDLSTHAKILGGGLPGACVTGKADIIDMIQFRDDAGLQLQRSDRPQRHLQREPSLRRGGRDGPRVCQRPSDQRHGHPARRAAQTGSERGPDTEGSSGNCYRRGLHSVAAHRPGVSRRRRNLLPALRRG